jgi:hypothetical protein
MLDIKPVFLWAQALSPAQKVYFATGTAVATNWEIAVIQPLPCR